jgi:hypothetical protein
MDINRWKSCAVDIESYTIIRAMGKQGFRRPGSMIAKLVDEEVRKIAKKEGGIEKEPGDWLLFFYLQ